MERVTGFVEERLIVGEPALRSCDEVDDLGRIGGDYAGAWTLLRPVLEIEADVRGRLEVEPEGADGLDAHIDRALLRIRRLERRQAAQPAELGVRRLFGVLRPEQPREPSPTQLLVRRRGVLRSAAQHAFELAEGDPLVGLVACHRIELAREAAFEVVPGDEQLPAALVEARVELPRQLPELFALRVVGEDRELRLGRAQRKFVAGVRQPCREERVLELVLAFRELGVDDAGLARPPQPVEALAVVCILGAGLGRTEHLELLFGEEN